MSISHGPATAMALQHKVVGNMSEKLTAVFSDGFGMYSAKDIEKYGVSLGAARIRCPIGSGFFSLWMIADTVALG